MGIPIIFPNLGRVVLGIPMIWVIVFMGLLCGPLYGETTYLELRIERFRVFSGRDLDLVFSVPGLRFRM